MALRHFDGFSGRAASQLWSTYDILVGENITMTLGDVALAGDGSANPAVLGLTLDNQASWYVGVAATFPGFPTGAALGLVCDDSFLHSDTTTGGVASTTGVPTTGGTTGSWIDNSGFTYSINGNQLKSLVSSSSGGPSAGTPAFLLRPPSENSLPQGITIDGPLYAIGDNVREGIALRWQASTGNFYGLEVLQGFTVLYKSVAGSVNIIMSLTAWTGGSWTTGHSYEQVFAVTAPVGGSNTLSFTITDTNTSTVMHAGSFTDNEVTLQAAGSAGITSWTNGGFAPFVVTRARTYGTVTSQVPITFLKIQDAGNAQVELGVNSSSKLQFTRAGTVIGTGTTTIVPNQRTYFEIGVTIASSISAGTAVASLDGANEITIPAGFSTKNTGNATANQVVLQTDAAYHSGHPALSIPLGATLFGDLYICDGTGSAPYNALLGRCQVDRIEPASAGTHTGFAPHGNAFNYQAADADAPGIFTAFVFEAAAGIMDTYGVTPLLDPPDVVLGVKINILAAKFGTTARTVAPVIRTSATDTVGTAIATSDLYAFQSQTWATNPVTAVAWTPADVNALEAGVKLVS